MRCSGMIDPGRGGGALTGQRAESLGLMLNALRFGLGPVAGFTPAGILDGNDESGLRTGWMALGVLSTGRLPAVLLSCRRLSGLSVSPEPAEAGCASGEEALGIRIARGHQSCGWTSQSSTRVCWAASAAMLPQPESRATTNAVIVVERNVLVRAEG